MFFIIQIRKVMMSYTDFINGGRTVKNWYLVMKTRHFRINNFRVTSDLGEFVRLYRVLKIFFIEQGICFIFSRSILK